MCPFRASSTGSARNVYHQEEAKRKELRRWKKGKE